MGECYRGVHGGRPVSRRLPQDFGEVQFESRQQARVLQGETISVVAANNGVGNYNPGPGVSNIIKMPAPATV
jgi:hypothetical protein